jgi:hypothetical protein
MNKKLWIIAAFACMALTGCMQMPMSYQPTLKNIEAIKTPNMAAVNVGTFVLAPGKPASLDTTISARGSTAVPPEGSFSKFLKSALIQDLRAAGKYDPKSTIVINGLLTENSLEAPIGTGKGALGAKFSVNRDGATVYQKELNEKAEWPSAFIGAEAIPTALNQYASLYKKLLGKLFGDADFQKATQAK